MNLTRINMRHWVLAIFGICCLGLNATIYILYEKNRQITESRNWVFHTYEVLNTSYGLFSELQDMQGAQRLFLLAGDAKMLKDYDSKKAAVQANFTKMLALTMDNLPRQLELQGLKAAIDEQESLLASQIQVRKSTGQFHIEDIKQNKLLMDRIATLNGKIQQEEQDLLVERSRVDRAHQRDYVMVVLIASVSSVIGLFVAAFGMTRLTRRRDLAEADLKRINKEMEGFVYIASHDLRSPLVNLRGFASEMRFNLEDLDPLIAPAIAQMSEADKQKCDTILHKEIPEALHYIHSSVEKMDKLTNAILELSRLGRRPLSIELVDMKKIVSRCVDTLHHQISTKNIEVIIHPLPNVFADTLGMEQVWGNLIDNAIKYLHTERRGRIEIGGSVQHRETTYWIQDNGRGILAADMEKIFEIYRRGGNNRNIPGEGMGMAYVRTTLRRLGGQIWCESVPDKGTTFYFTVSNGLGKEQKNG